MLRRSIFRTVRSTCRPLCLQYAGRLHGWPRSWTPPRPERGMASVAAAAATTATPAAPGETAIGSPPSTAADGTDVGVGGPLVQYDSWVRKGKLRDDAFQRGIVSSLQGLHDQLAHYNPPPVVPPTIESLALQSQLRSRTSLLDAVLGRRPQPSPATAAAAAAAATTASTAPANARPPKGLYLHGDVGSGKTMLMDMFFNTLPPNMAAKKRIHFHHFMQDVHRRLHQLKLQHGLNLDALPLVGAQMAEQAAVLCFDEFQCTDVADAMILRRLLHSMLGHGVVLVATSNRPPDELYRNGIQRQSFLPCIDLLKRELHVIALDSPTDYRKLPRPSSGVYFQPAASPAASAHADKWFAHLADPADSPSPRTHTIWGRRVRVPRASGSVAQFDFMDLCGAATSAADYLELCRHYRAFVVTNVPAMDHRSRDLARRFITFIDAVYESRATLVLTVAVPMQQLFVSDDDVRADGATELDSSMRNLMDDLGMDMAMLRKSSIFSGEEERFAFARALSRLAEMGGAQWQG